METIINILQAILWIAKIGLSLSILLLIVCLCVWASDEYKESRRERSLELARTSAIDTFFARMVKEKREYEARHQFDKTKKQYRHRPRPEPTYIERVRARTNKLLPIRDDDYFAALLKEQKEFAPSW